MSAQADWNAQLDDFEKLMLLKALKEEKVNLSFRDKHSKVNIYTYLLVLDEWEMSQVSVSILIVLQARLMGNEPSCCQYTNMLHSELEMSHISLGILACCRPHQK